MDNFYQLVELASSGTVAFVIVILLIILYGWLGFLLYRMIRDVQYTKLARKYLDDELIRREEDEKR